MLDRSVSSARRAERGEVGTLRLGFVATALFNILPRLLEELKTQLPMVTVELRESPSSTQMQLLQSGDLDLGLGYLEEVPKQISSAIVLSEPFILVLHEKHRAAKKRVVLFEDLKDDLLLIPRKDLFPTLYQAIIDLLLAAAMTDMRTQDIEHPLTALALASANAGFAFVPASAQELSARGVVFRPLNADVPPLEIVALWSNASPDPLVARVVDIPQTFGEREEEGQLPNRTSAVRLSSLLDHSTSWDNSRYRESQSSSPRQAIP
jgi:DNA-binding transcriptional LysR family regulator